MTATPLPAHATIDLVRIGSLLVAAQPPWPLDVVAATGSTNTDLAQQLKALPRTRQALPRPIVRVAYEQTAGRGRQGRPWFAQPGNALLCSVGCVLPRPVEKLGGLSLAVGVALAEGLATLPLAAGHGIALKWPNDLLGTSNQDGATVLTGKLAGILIETVWHTRDATAAVIGFGINVRGAEAVAADVAALRASNATLAEGLPPSGLPPSGLPPSALSSAWPAANLTDTLAAALNALSPALALFGTQGFAPFRTRWNALHAHADREVMLLEQGVEIVRGTATGVDDTGQLLLDTATGRQVIAAGDISVREPGSRP